MSDPRGPRSCAIPILSTGSNRNVQVAVSPLEMEPSFQSPEIDVSSPSAETPCMSGRAQPPEDSCAPRQATGVEKNLEKWLRVPNFGTQVEGTRIIPTKMFSRYDYHGHTCLSFLEANPRVRLLIDLSTEVGAYTVPSNDVAYVKISSISKQLPSLESIRQYVEIVKEFEKNHPDPNVLLATQCHYAYNRTGFFVTSYLCEALGISADEAIERFARARPPGIKHEHFKEELRLRYGKGSATLS